MKIVLIGELAFGPFNNDQLLAFYEEYRSTNPALDRPESKILELQFISGIEAAHLLMEPRGY